MLFDQDELEIWLKQGRIGQEAKLTEAELLHHATAGAPPVVDISASRVYHRSARYR